METSKQVTKEISQLVQQIQPDACVFTRDLHPMNHLSFMDDEGRVEQPGITWPRHCRNQRVKCASRVKNPNIEDGQNTSAPAPPKQLKDVKSGLQNKNMIETIIQNGAYKEFVAKYSKSKPTEELFEAVKSVVKLYQEVYTPSNRSQQISLLELLGKLNIRGNEISYLFYLTPLLIPCLMMNMGNKIGKYKIGLAETRNEIDTNNTLELKDGTYGQIAQPEDYFEFNVNDKKTKFVALTKGERCDQESYSAFNYHVAYKLIPGKLEVMNVAPPAFDEKNSTGLWEWILANRGDAEVIEIYVCGLVGNVCVIQSVLQGMAIWKHYYQAKNPKISVQFKFSLLGTRFTAVLPPNKMDPYEVGIAIKEPNEIKADFPIWLKGLAGAGLLGNIVDNEKNDALAGYKFNVYTGDPDAEIEIDVNIKTLYREGKAEADAKAKAEAAPAGGKRRTRKIKYCKICKGCCKKTHAKNRRNLRKTRR